MTAVMATTRIKHKLMNLFVHNARQHAKAAQPQINVNNAKKTFSRTLTKQSLANLSATRYVWTFKVTRSIMIKWKISVRYVQRSKQLLVGDWTATQGAQNVASDISY